MRACVLLLSQLLLAVCFFCGKAQAAPFQNLDFESAGLPALPLGQYGTLVPIAQALPGWSASLGDDSVTQVLHNNVTLGSAAIWIWGPAWPYATASAGGRIEGNFTPVLFAGGNGPPLTIYQTGLVPADTEWLMFKGRSGSPLEGIVDVSLNGQSVLITTLGTFPEHSLFGGRISEFAGSEAELRFTVYQGLGHGLIVDSIVFVVPEPGGFGLFAVGVAAAVWWRRWQTRWRST